MYPAPKRLSDLICTGVILYLCVSRSSTWVIDRNNEYGLVLKVQHVTELECGKYVMQISGVDIPGIHSFNIFEGNIEFISSRRKTTVALTCISNQVPENYLGENIVFHNTCLSHCVTALLRDMRHIYSNTISVYCSGDEYIIRCIENETELVVSSGKHTYSTLEARSMQHVPLRVFRAVLAQIESIQQDAAQYRIPCRIGMSDKGVLFEVDCGYTYICQFTTQNCSDNYYKNTCMSCLRPPIWSAGECR